ncbi:MAG: hypothetical protein Q7T38_00960 [Gallionella sp.]|nr:hypothetical protein [Gallionella sp.]
MEVGVGGGKIIRDKFSSAVGQLKRRKLVINGVGSKVCVTLYGKPPGQGDDNRVSGLEIWQRNYLLLLRSMGLNLVEIYFVWGGQNKIENTHGNIYVLHLDDKKRVFQMEREANAHGLSYPKEARVIEDMLLNIFEKERVGSIILINWISTGMIIWQACLRFGKPVIFIPTEHSSVCHLGFFLNPSGSACSGPDGGGGMCKLYAWHRTFFAFHAD